MDFILGPWCTPTIKLILKLKCRILKWFIIYNPEEQTTEGFNLINIVNNRLNAFKQIFTMLYCALNIVYTVYTIRFSPDTINKWKRGM